MGYRIELDEIETALNEIDAIRECAIIFGKKNGYQEITAIVCSSMKKQAIKLDLKEKIPEFMIPRKIIYKESLPKNVNGKIDRKQLSEEHFDTI